MKLLTDGTPTKPTEVQAELLPKKAYIDSSFKNGKVEKLFNSEQRVLPSYSAQEEFLNKWTAGHSQQAESRVNRVRK